MEWQKSKTEITPKFTSEGGKRYSRRLGELGSPAARRCPHRSVWTTFPFHDSSRVWVDAEPPQRGRAGNTPGCRQSANVLLWKETAGVTQYPSLLCTPQSPQDYFIKQRTLSQRICRLHVSSGWVNRKFLCKHWKRKGTNQSASLLLSTALSKQHQSDSSVCPFLLKRENSAPR